MPSIHVVWWFMHIPAHILQQAIDLYLANAYPASTAKPGSAPKPLAATIVARTSPIRALAPTDEVPLALLEHDTAHPTPRYVLRLGQPMYPHMKLVADSVPVDCNAAPCLAPDFILRVDSHDRHLHAAPGSPDAAWLESVRMSNKELGERIESAWSAAGLPTFKEYLRQKLDASKKAHAAEHHP